MNLNLEVSPFINNFHPLSKQIIRFRLGSHCLPIETGRWGRITRENRLCVDCGVLGDELHALYHCSNIDRSDINLPDNLDQVWESPDLFKLFQRLQERNCLDWIIYSFSIFHEFSFFIPWISFSFHEFRFRSMIFRFSMIINLGFLSLAHFELIDLMFL